jgi:hypothetical protein
MRPIVIHSRIANMETTLQKLFKKLEWRKPSDKLEKAIMDQIILERNRQIKRKLATAYAGIFASLSALAYVTSAYGKTLLKSEFWNIFSLAFSDMTIVFKHWSDFLLSLQETFPTLIIAAMLVPIFAILLFLGYYLDISSKNNQKYI